MPNGIGFQADFGGSNPYSGSGGSSGNNDFEKFLSMFGNNKGLFGLGDLATGGLLSGGASLLSGIGGLLGGKSTEEKALEQMMAGRQEAFDITKDRTGKTFNLAQNRLGQSVLDPNQYLAEYMQSVAPQQRQATEAIGKRLDLDSGVAQGALLEQQQAPLAQFMLQAKQQNDVLKSRNDNMLLNLMGGLGRVNFG